MEFEITKKQYILQASADLRALPSDPPFNNRVTADALEFCANTGVFDNIKDSSLTDLTNWLSGYSNKAPDYVNDEVFAKTLRLLEIRIPEAERNAKKVFTVISTLKRSSSVAADIKDNLSLEEYCLSGCTDWEGGVPDILGRADDIMDEVHCGEPPMDVVEALDVYEAGYHVLMKKLREVLGKRKHKLSVLYARFGKILYRAYASYQVTDKGTSTNKRCAECVHALKKMDEEPCLGCGGTERVNWTPKSSEVKSGEDGGS